MTVLRNQFSVVHSERLSKTTKSFYSVIHQTTKLRHQLRDKGMP